MEKLVELLRKETSSPLHEILLLRHSNANIAKLRKLGGTVEEYTALQPKLSKYDFWHPKKPRIKFVCVIADNSVYGVFEITGVNLEGWSRQISSMPYREYDAKNDDRDCRLFELKLVPSSVVGQRVYGWQGKEIVTVLRAGTGFSDALEVDVSARRVAINAFEEQFQTEIKAALLSTVEERRVRLAIAPVKPTRRAVLAYVFDRNADVVATVLLRARGVCEGCLNPAPFTRRTDGSPYLEVHHRTPLAEGGLDTVENAIALCPNCHRARHYG